MDKKQLSTEKGARKHFFKNTVVIILAILVFLPISFFISAALLELPGRIFISRPDHPLYANYVGLFYNTKCSHTQANFTEYDILDELYYLGIPKDKAKELFEEAKKDLEEDMTNNKDLGTIQRCAQETLDYYDKALNVLKYLGDKSDRTRDGFPEGFNE